MLDLFHPLIRAYFAEKIGRPTAIQELAWPQIAAGEHVLVSAPTGSGKTLTAFLWAIDRLIVGAWPRGSIQVLYVSPLKALNTDVRRNLEAPLAGIEATFRAAGEEAPSVRVMTRSGDTPGDERRRMVRHPPEILITTPESLNVLLTSKSGRGLLTDLRVVILDEIHAVFPSKRGTHLITAIDRLVPLAGEFQRIALSATVRPMERIAAWIGGFQLESQGDERAYTPRPVKILRATNTKTYEIGVRFPGAPGLEYDQESVWDLIVPDLRRTIDLKRSTLLFANSRRMTEKIARLVNSGRDETLITSHHGSLSREVRSVIEDKLKKGLLKALVATNSLELGIDIGDLDQVILLQTPRSFASAIQRVGRAGHGVGQISRGLLYPTHGRDFLDAAVVAPAIINQDIEEMKMVAGALDVLAQVILSMCCGKTWSIAELYDQVRTSAPYRHLERRHFDLLIEMLAGRYAAARLRELQPRLMVDAVRGTVKARPGVDRLLYMAGGTISDRGYFTLRHHESLAKIGELDEEFVWERSIGDAFSFGAQSWQIRAITHNDVLVQSARGPAAALAPFWRADAQDRGFAMAQAILEFLEKAEGRLTDPAFFEALLSERAFEDNAARELLHFLSLQTAATGGRLPRRDRLLVERCSDLTKGSGKKRLIYFTFWGGQVHRPLSLAFAAAFEEHYGEAPEIVHDDYALMVRVPDDFDPAELFNLVAPDKVEELLRHKLESSGFFGAHFRLCAGTSLLLPKNSFNQRMPLWLSRERAKKLLEAVREAGDFPIVLETWRTCLQDEFDLTHLKERLSFVRSGDLPLEVVATDKPSPLAGGLVWDLTNRLMYEDDVPLGRPKGALRLDLLRELVFARELRPKIPRPLSEKLRSKLQRLASGYAPRPGEDLAFFVAERVAIPSAEWSELLAAVARDHDLKFDEVAATVADTVGWWRQDAGQSAVVAVAVWPRLVEVLGSEIGLFEGLDGRDLLVLEPVWQPDFADPSAELGAATLLGEWLRFYGAVAVEAVTGLWPGAAEHLETLVETRTIVVDTLSDEDRLEVCDSQNLEILLRWLRQEQRPSFETLPLRFLQLFLLQHQGLLERGHDLEHFQERLEKLFGLPLPAALWETEVLPARLEPYFPAWLDAALHDSDLLWSGCGREKLTFAFAGERALLTDAAAEAHGSAEDDELLAALADGRARTIEELAEALEVKPSAIHDRLWPFAWSGLVGNDGFLAVRKGIEQDFQAPNTTEAPKRGFGRRQGWQRATLWPGRWQRLEPEIAALDALEQAELDKERARLLLERWGVVFRELVQRELPALQWSRVFRSLRLMELSGEVVAGLFFEDIPGLQFMAPGAFRTLQRGLPEDRMVWLSAADPASLAGIELEALKGQLPPRLAVHHLVYLGTELVLISRRKARELEFRLPADHPRLLETFEVLKHLLTRKVLPLPSLQVETINGENAATSPYLRRLESIFQVTREGDSARLWRNYLA